MKKLLKINKIFILLVLYLCCSTVNLYAQVTKIMHTTLDFDDVAAFGGTDIGVKGDGSGKVITVEVFSYASYKATDTKDSASFLFGFKSANTNNTDYVNTSLGNVTKANDNPYSEDMFTTHTFQTNNLRYFKSQTEKAATEQGTYFNSLNSGTIDVVVKVTVAGTGATIGAAKNIKLPGLVLNPSASITGQIKVYRGDSTTPVRTLDVTSGDLDSEFNLEVFQGDRVDFIAAAGTTPSVKNLVDNNVMRWAGEVLYVANKFKQNDIKPFLFLDSNVHGVKLRKYPENLKNGNHKYPDFEPTSVATNADLKLSWIANGRSEYKSIMATNNKEYTINTNLKSYKEQDGGYPNSNKFFDPNQPNLKYQRNNQKEGLNMELLEAQQRNKKFVAGLDPDELIYKDFSSSIIVGNSAADGKIFNYVANDQWKVISDDQIKGINYSMHEFLNAIGQYRADKKYRFIGHEIVDKNLYVYKTGSTTIEGKTFDYTQTQPMFNDKRPVFYNPVIGNTPIIDNQVLNFIIGGRDFKINLAVLSPLEGKRKNVAYNALTVAHRQNPVVNFYGIIAGPIFVSRYQANATYTVENLPNTADVPGTFSLVYTYEDSYGILTSVRKEVSGAEPSASFNIQGGGYHDITLQYKRSKTASNADYVIIAGKELIDVDLRFIFSPNAAEVSDFSYNGTQTFGATTSNTNVGGNVRLNENKANGKSWFLDNNNEKLKTSGYGNTHGYKDHKVVRTYTLDRDETVTLTVLDADPHSFVHYQPDFYLSERRLSKRATDADLANSAGNSKIEWFIAKDADFTDGKTSKGYGRYLKIAPKLFYPGGWTTGAYKGAFYVKAVFNNTSEIIVKIVQKEIGGLVRNLEDEEDLGAIGKYYLSDDQWTLLKKIAPAEYEGKDILNFRIYKIKDILSSYTYGEKNTSDVVGGYVAKRYSIGSDPVGEHARFSDMNNYDSRFTWKFIHPITNNIITFTDICYDFRDGTSSSVANNLYISNYQNTWFPKNWVRHLDSPKKSPEIPNVGSQIKEFNENQTATIQSYHFNSTLLYEPWQVRLPWIAQSGIHGYKTRWNIKCIYDVDKIFDTAKIGTAYNVSDDSATYSSKVIGNGGDKVIANFTDLQREYQEFYHMLKNREIVIVDIAKLNFRTPIAQPSNLSPTPTIKLEVKDIYNVVFGGIVNKGSINSDKLAQTIKEEFLPISNNKQLSTVYPNPSNSGIFTIDINVTQVNTIVNLQLIDLTGRIIYTSKPKIVNDNYSTTIGENVLLPKGTYLLTIKVNDTSETKKLIVN